MGRKDSAKLAFKEANLGMQKRLVRLIARVAALLVFATSIPGVAQTASPSTLRDGSHDFDFSAGRWRTDVTIFKDPIGHPDESTHMAGTKVVRPVWNGKAWFEEIEADGPSGHWEAANLFLYDPRAHQWSQNYVDSADGRFDGSPAIGEYRNGQLEFYWQAKLAGRAILVRGTWSDFTPTSHTYKVDRSIDGGRTWHTSFIARLTKIS
jgi:hypothetical protein